MYLYKVKETYIEYLKNEDTRVLDNKKNRPYLGVVLEVDGIDYYVPLSSEKENKRLNTQLSMKIKDLNGEVIGYLQFLNMIPVHVDDLITLDVELIKEEDPEYYNIITKEMIFIRKNKEKIIKKAQQVYKNRTNIEGLSYEFYDKLCVNYKKLEIVYAYWVM